MARGNGKIFFDAPNRGSKRILGFLNDGPEANDPATLEHAGNGFLMRQGYTIVWCGWQGDLMPLKNWLVLNVPVATNKGKPIVAKIRTEIVVDEKGVKSQPLSADERVKSYEAASRDKSRATLTVREKSYGKRIPVPASEWEFAASVKDPRSGKEVIKASSTDLYLHRGFKPGHIYEFIYPAKNPLVLGLGFAVARDFVSFLRFETKDRAGKANPLAPAKKTASITHAYAWGRSQSGRYLRDFVYHGFNEDEQHRKVFDAIAPHVGGGGRLFMNYEFARPVTSSQQHTNQLDPELFPHTYNIIKDAQTGRRDGILKRPKTDPLIFHTQTSTEYWQKRGCSPTQTARAMISSYRQRAPLRHRQRPAQQSVRLRASQRRQSVSRQSITGRRYPARAYSRHGSVGDKRHRAAAEPISESEGWHIGAVRLATAFRRLPGMNFTGLHNRQLFLDYGPNILRGKMAIHPPRPIGKAYEILLPKVDIDGNDIAGIRLPAVQVPIGTYTGWNLRPRGLAEGELAGLLGSFIPFAKTKAPRRKTGDPACRLKSATGTETITCSESAAPREC